ncbi:MAG: efflux RND transporter permease subunit [Gammaproteobacteria bacterium]|nr:efflux RND transporter permease subunit [Gammaproteobacteria bacterium]
MPHDSGNDGAAGGFVRRVMGGPLPPLLMLLALILGAVALVVTPREEEPQIVVPLADVLIRAPGLDADQVERQVATPLEKLLAQIDGVEHVYSMSRADEAIVTVRFYVGEPRENSLVKVYNKLHSNLDQVPAAVASWVVKPIEIDDVPIVVVGLWSSDPERIGDHELRRLGEEMVLGLKAIDRTNRVEVVGGRPRQVRVELDALALAARATTPLEVAQALQASNVRLPAGTLPVANREVVLEAGEFVPDAEALAALVVNVVNGVPVRLGDVARVRDGPAEVVDYTWLGFGPAAPAELPRGARLPMVALSIAKQKGANAVWVAADVHRHLARLERELLPPAVHLAVLRDYGRTADAKVDELVTSLVIAVVTVVVFIGLFIGWRPALVVALAIPVCYGATLALDYAGGYTINRVTLFALILALGLLVDDPITGIDNIERFLRRGGRDRAGAIAAAIGEIRGPLIMSTVAIVLAFAPLAFITGMMGPYMAPMAFNVPVSVTASTVVAFLVTPWLAARLLPPARVQSTPVEAGATYRVYARVVGALVASRRRAGVFLAFVAVLFVLACTLPALRLVPLKLLPYDNKDEFQLVVDMPEGTTLERTEAVAAALADYLVRVPEVDTVAAFTGLASPIDFNGLVRHDYLRRGGHVADLRVTLAPRQARAAQSHAIALRLRPDLERLAAAHGARLGVVEVPPGPPVLATLTVELYGTPTTPYAELEQAAALTAARLAAEPLVVDVDTSVAAAQPRLSFVTDQRKAALSGVAVSDIAGTLALAGEGLTAGHLEIASEAQPLPIRVRLPLATRSDSGALESLYVKGRPGIAKLREGNALSDAPQPLVQLGELGRFEAGTVASPRYHKDLRPVAYAYAELAGRPPAAVVFDVAADLDVEATAPASAAAPRPLAGRTFLANGGGLPWALPAGVSANWDGEGEWHITLRVFRDMGLAFAAALVGIFFVLYVETRSAVLALIIMSAIPLTLIGVMPGFWLLNQLGERSVGALPDPVLFTATAMIGMIALAGIVVRNSLILVEFVRGARADGLALREALYRAGAVRMRPVLLTAGTTLLGNLVITLDPIFSGLAWCIIFGILASTVFTLAVVPAVYFLVYGKQEGAAAEAAHTA